VEFVFFYFFMYTSIVCFLVNCVEAVSRAPCIFSLFEISLSRSVSEYIFHPCNLALVEEVYSNLVVESRDEILFKGGRL
jgi:hypothetical protein